MKLRYFVVDAFTSEPFRGNPAAVVPLTSWPNDALLQSIAAEMNLSETAFFAPENDGFRLRWMTPAMEVDLCGHATLASAHVLFEVEPERSDVKFETRSGMLSVKRTGDSLAMDFPSMPTSPLGRGGVADTITRALGKPPSSLVKARDVIAIYDTAEEVRDLRPDLAAIASVFDVFAVCATAPGTGNDRDVDFVSRFFAPAKGVPEDPVTGSAHCQLTPYWSARLKKTTLRARQVSKRGGEMTCILQDKRVVLEGRAIKVAEGELHLP